MSVRFTSTGGLQRTANLPPWNAMTICGWASRNTDTNNYAAVSAFSDSTGGMSNGGMYIFGADGDTLGGYTPNNGESAISPAKTPANDVPFFWAMVVSGTGAGAWTLYYREELDGAFTTLSLQGAASSWTPAAIWAGHNPFGEWLNGSVEHVKCWDAALNSTELDAEFNSATPVRTTSLNFYWPCSTTSDTNDASGNGRNPTISGSITNGATLFPFGAGGTTMPCDAGSFTLTGGDLTFRRFKLTCDAGSFTLTGSNVGLAEGSAQTGGLVVGSSTSFVGEGWIGAGEAPPSGSPYTLTIEAGSFALTGGAVGLKQGYVLPIAAGSFTLTGSDAARDLSMSLTAGSFTLTGGALTLTPSGSDPVLTADAGTFTLTGQAIGLRAARTLTLSAGSFALTGQAATLAAGRTFSLAAGAFSLSGQDVTLTYDPAAILICEAGSFVVGGQIVDLRYSGVSAGNGGEFILLARRRGRR